MRFVLFLGLLLAGLNFTPAAQAQQSVWIQIEAQPNLGKALERARIYAGRLDGVHGFAMRTGWYALVIGPLSPPDATETLQQLRITRQIPADSYITDGTPFRRQFWPIGSAALAPAPAPLQPEPQIGPAPAAQSDDTAQPAAAVIGAETPAQARASERLLSRKDRELLQAALKWEGFYRSAIDGDFGPGTRKSMAAWQRNEGYEATGILTSAQRRVLLDRYNAVVTALQITHRRDDVAGIEIDLPMGLIAFDRYEPPFAHFKPRGDSGVRALLISQTGDQTSLRALFDIMQTLEIVPLDGPRSIKRNSFTLTGANTQIVSHTYAALKNGQIKGFTLVWPAGDEKRRRLAVERMRASFASLPDSVLPDVYGSEGAQSVDLLSGLNLRKPRLSRTGFYVSATGAVVTSADVVANCTRITLDQEQQAEVVAQSPELGLALLRPLEALAPLRVSQLRLSPPRIKSEIAVSGYSYEGLLGAPTLTFGTLADLRGLKGDTNLRRVSLDIQPGDAGGPIFDASGAVIGVLLPEPANATCRSTCISPPAPRRLRNFLTRRASMRRPLKDRARWPPKT